MGTEMTKEEFLATYQPMVKKVALRYALRIPDDTDYWRNELYQQSILQLLLLYDNGQFQEDNPGKNSYIYQSISGWIKDYLKKFYPFTLPEPDDDQQSLPEGPDSHQAIQEENFLKYELLSLINKFMEKLSPLDRFILIAYFIEGKSYEDIGRVLRRSRQWVSRKVKEFTVMLKNYLRKQGWTTVSSI